MENIYHLKQVEPNKRNLFQNDWKSSDIAKSREEAKRKDMEVLMNRFKTVSQTDEQNCETPLQKSPSPRPRSRSPVRKSPAKPVRF